MNEGKEHILSAALDLLEQQTSVDEIIARFPEDADELQPFLLTAQALSGLAYQPFLDVKQNSLESFLAAADGLVNKPAPVRRGWAARLLAPVLAAIVFLVVGSFGLGIASRSATPGSVLYGTKLWVEDMRVRVSNNPEAAAELIDQFRQERLVEAERLLAAGIVADVSITGQIDELWSEKDWVVEGLTVRIDSTTALEGTPVVGGLVKIDGRTVGGAIIAHRVIVLSGELPQATPETDPTILLPTIDSTTPRMTATEENTPAAIFLPESTIAPTGTAKPTQQLTGDSTASPTAEPPTGVLPTAAPPTMVPPTTVPPTTPPGAPTMVPALPSATPRDDGYDPGDDDDDDPGDDDDDDPGDDETP